MGTEGVSCLVFPKPWHLPCPSALCRELGCLEPPHQEAEGLTQSGRGLCGLCSLVSLIGCRSVPFSKSLVVSWTLTEPCELGIFTLLSELETEAQTGEMTCQKSHSVQRWDSHWDV